jgi:Multiubiquitin
MGIVPEAALERGQARHMIDVADQKLTFRSVPIEDLTPTGAQLAAATGFKPVQQATVLHVLANGELEDIRPDETVDLRHGDGRFIIVESDRIYRFTLDGEQLDWPCRIISGGVLRKLGQVPDDKEIYLECGDERDRLIRNHDLVDLDAPGVERFATRKHIWKLNVQGVILDVPAPIIVVREALTLAGFNPDRAVGTFS